MTSLSNLSPSCRICYGGKEQGLLQSFCNCTGTIGYCHHDCLSRWVKEAGRTKCELCQYELDVRTKTEHFWKWHFPPMDPDVAAHLSFNVCCCILAVGMAILHYFLVFWTATQFKLTLESIFGLYLENLLLLLISCVMLAVDFISSLKPIYHELVRANSKVIILPKANPVPCHGKK